MRRGLLPFPAAGLALLLPVLCLTPAAPVHGGEVGVPISLTVDPASIKQGDDSETFLKTIVTLQGPSPEYFICEVRSEDKRKIACSDIIIKKGDTGGVGIATVKWSEIEADGPIKITARNVETPDVVVSFTVTLQVRTTE
jgi:hypothetical protein